MDIERGNQDYFATVEINLPDSMKLLMNLKDKFNILDSNAHAILKSIKTDNVESEKESLFIQQNKRTFKLMQKCPLYAAESHTQKVAGEGTLNSPLVLIGEGPI